MSDTAHPAPGPSKSKSMLIALSGIVVVGALIWYGVARVLEVTSSALNKKMLNLELVAVDDVNGPAISPGGDLLVYTREGELWLHDIETSEESHPLAGTEGAERPFWSPDGRRVGFFRDAMIGMPSLHSVSIQDEVVDHLSDLPPGYLYGAVWKSDETIIIGLTPRTRGYGGGELHVVSEQKGTARVFLQPMEARSESGIMYPSYMPGGETLIYALTTLDGAGAVVARTEDSYTTLISHQGEALAFPVYSPSGHVIYQRGFPRSTGIWALPIDPETVTKAGDPYLISATGRMPTVSVDGTLSYHIPPTGEMRQLVLVDRQGTVQDTISVPQEEMDFPMLSPDGTRVAVAANQNHNIDIWIHNLKDKTKIRLTSHRGLDHYPAWATSGNHVAFSSTRNNSGGIYYRRANGRGRVGPLISQEAAWAPSWGRRNTLVYQLFSPDTQSDLYFTYPWSKSKPRMPFLASPAFEATPSLSPKRLYMAYTSDKSGRPEVYVSTFPKAVETWRISQHGGALPRWSEKGNELLFIETTGANDPSAMLMSVPIATGNSFQFQKPEPLFDLNKVGTTTALGSYDITNDGQRFIIVQSIDETPKVQISIAENWHREFKE